LNLRKDPKGVLGAMRDQIALTLLFCGLFPLREKRAIFSRKRLTAKLVKVGSPFIMHFVVKIKT